MKVVTIFLQLMQKTRQSGLPLAIACALLASGAQAFAQAPDCAQLLGQIAALDRANAQTNPYASGIQNQRAQLERSIGYSHSIGCDRQQFLFFGSPPPAQCPQLKAQINQQRANLQQLEANAAASNNTPQRQALVARYNSACRQPQRPRGFFESLFGGGESNPAPPSDSLPLPGETPPPTDTTQPTSGSEALCVRTCDGGFFPLIYSARRSPETLTELCKASCPDAEVRVYTRVPGQPVNTAVGLDGTPYMDLPAALKFEKTYDPACTCKPPGESWAEALANAERILGHEGKGDIIVTPEKSAEMARPKQNAASSRTSKAAAKTTDDREAHDAASAEQVPTASDESSGISAGQVRPTASYPQGEGKTVEVTGPDGAKHEVRIVGPQP